MHVLQSWLVHKHRLCNHKHFHEQAKLWLLLASPTNMRTFYHCSIAPCRDLSLAAQLSALTSLHLHLSPSSTDAHEQRLLGGIITAAGARALAEGLPLLSSLALCQCHVTRDGLAQLGGMRQLRAINLTGRCPGYTCFELWLLASQCSRCSSKCCSGLQSFSARFSHTTAQQKLDPASTRLIALL